MLALNLGQCFSNYTPSDSKIISKLHAFRNEFQKKFCLGIKEGQACLCKQIILTVCL